MPDISAAGDPRTVAGELAADRRSAHELALHTPTGVIKTRRGTRGVLAVGISRSARQIGRATLVLPNEPDASVLVEHGPRPRHSDMELADREQ